MELLDLAYVIFSSMVALVRRSLPGGVVVGAPILLPGLPSGMVVAHIFRTYSVSRFIFLTI